MVTEIASGGSRSSPSCFLPNSEHYRRHELSGSIVSDQAALKYADLLDLPVELWPYELLAPRACSFRQNPHCLRRASYSSGRSTGVALVTLDRRIRSPQLQCEVAAP